VGTHDITHSKVGSLRRSEYRKKYEQAYLEDMKQYGGELTLDCANRRLLGLSKTRETVLRMWDEACSGMPRKNMNGAEASIMKFAERLPRKPLSKEILLKLNRFLLQPADVDANIVIQDPFEFGNIAEILYAEKLPTIRLWNHFKDYLIGGTPDGVAESYVYEFKATTQTDKEVERIKKMGTRQALLYAYVFRRPQIKIQITEFQMEKNPFPLKVKDLPKPKITTNFEPASDDEALAILQDFDLAFREIECESG